MGNNLIPIILTKIQSTERKIDKLGQIVLDTKKVFEADDYRDFIKVPLNTLEKLYKYDGRYYRKESEILAALAVPKKPYGFSNQQDDYYWQFNINIIYASEVFDTRYLMTSDGVLISKKTLKARSNRWKPSVNIKINNEQMTVSKGVLVYGLFVDPSIHLTYDEIIYIDSDVANADLPNIDRK